MKSQAMILSAKIVKIVNNRHHQVMILQFLNNFTKEYNLFQLYKIMNQKMVKLKGKYCLQILYKKN